MKPKVTDVNELQAGRDVDIEILVRVFGFNREKIFYEDYDTDKEHPMFIPSGKSRRTHMIDAVEVPYFSKRIDGAMNVAEKLKTRFGLIELRLFHTQTAEYQYEAMIGNVDWRSAQTLPLAICRAALSAVSLVGEKL